MPTCEQCHYPCDDVDTLVEYEDLSFCGSWCFDAWYEDQYGFADETEGDE